MQPREEAGSAGPQMRSETQVEGAGNRADSHCLGNPTAKGRIWLQYVGCPHHGEITEGVTRGFALTGCDRYRAAGPHFSHARLVVGSYRLFEPCKVEVADEVDEALGLGHRIGAVRIYHDVDFRPERVSCSTHPLCRDTGIAVHCAHAHLHGLEAPLVDIGTKLFADARSVRPAAGGVGRQAVSLPAANEPPDWLAERFAQNVPQRDVDSADRRHAHAAARDMRRGLARPCRQFMARAVVEHFPDGGDVGRIAANELRPDLVVEHMDKGAIAAGAASSVLGLAPADKAIIRLNPQNCGVKGRYLPKIAAMLSRRLDRDAYPPGLSGLDAHGALPTRRRRGLSVAGSYLIKGRIVSAVMRI